MVGLGSLGVLSIVVLMANDTQPSRQITMRLADWCRSVRDSIVWLLFLTWLTRMAVVDFLLRDLGHGCLFSRRLETRMMAVGSAGLRRFPRHCFKNELTSQHWYGRVSVSEIGA